MAVYDGSSIEKIGRQSRVAALRRIAFDVAVAEEAFLRWFLIAPGEANNDDVNVCHATSIAAPSKCAVSEADFKAVPIEQNRPELCNLFTLRDRIGSNEADSCERLPEIITGFDEPRSDVVKGPAAPAQMGNAAPLPPLLVTLVLRAAEGWIS